MSDLTFANLSTRDLLTFYYKNRRQLMVAFFVPFLLAVAVSFVPTPRYKASSVLVVRMGSEYVYQPETGTSQNSAQPSIPFEQDQIFKAEVAILNSDDLHAEVIRQIGIDTLYPGIEDDDAVTKFVKQTGLGSYIPQDAPADERSRDAGIMEKAITKFDKRFDVELEKESSVITVSFEHKDPEVAVRALDILLKLYMEKRKDLYLEPRVATAKSRAEESHRRALAAENAIEAFKHDHNIFSFEAERQNLIQQRGDIQKQAAIVSTQSLNEKLAYFEQKLDELNKEEAQFNTLTHDASVANDEYTVFAHRLNEAIAYEDLEHARAGSVRVIQPPASPAEPKALQLVIIAAGFVFSLIIVILRALMLDFFSSGFLTPEQLAKAVKLPVLVVLQRKKA